MCLRVVPLPRPPTRNRALSRPYQAFYTAPMRGGCRRLLAGGLGSVALVLGLAAVPGGATVQPGLKPPFGTNWTVYHQNLMASGVDPVNTDLNTLKPGWTSPKLDGGLFGEPLVDDGRVVVATENDTVYSLSAQTGSVLWSTHLGTPVPVYAIPCPSVVSPVVGITGTPYIDLARNEIFVVAMEQHGFTVQHRLYGLNLFDGSIDLDQDVDPPGSQPLQELQRTGLTASQGRIIVTYTGFGDCGSYHGWVLGIPESGGPMRTFKTATARLTSLAASGWAVPHRSSIRRATSGSPRPTARRRIRSAMT